MKLLFRLFLFLGLFLLGGYNYLHADASLNAQHYTPADSFRSSEDVSLLPPMTDMQGINPRCFASPTEQEENLIFAEEYENEHTEWASSFKKYTELGRDYFTQFYAPHPESLCYFFKHRLPLFERSARSNSPIYILQQVLRV